MELILLAAIAYAAARGVESVIDDVKGNYSSKVADATVRKAAKNKTDGIKDPAKSGGTFSAKDAAPRTASLGTRTAAGIATGLEAGATFRKSYLEGYREAWPTAREEARKRQVERVKRRQAEREARLAERRAQTAEQQAADAKNAEPSVIVVTPPAQATETEPPTVTPPVEPPPAEPAPVADAPAKPTLVLLKDPNPEPAPAVDPVLTGDIVTIPEVRTLDGLIHALGIIKAVSLMRAEEANAIAADDAQLAAQLDALAADLAGQKVDAGTLAEVYALRELVTVQSATAQQYQAAAQNAADMSSGAADAAHKSHGGINEAIQSSPVPAAAEAGYYNR